jgi:hypothetical protein
MMVAWFITAMVVVLAVTLFVVVYVVRYLETHEQDDCDHCYYPTFDELDYQFRYPTGQRCVLCGKFNPIEDVLRNNDAG